MVPNSLARKALVMILDENFFSPKEILDRFPLLSREKLTYWADKGYLRTKRIIIRERTYKYFHIDDLDKIGLAVELIVVGNMKDKKAFQMIDAKIGAVDQNQLSIFQLTK